MSRKWTTLAVTAASAALLVAGLSIAQDEKEKSPLHQIMEKVQAKHLAITKAVRTPIAFKKAGNGKEIVGDANDMLKLFKEAREIKDAAEAQKQPVEKWDKAMDDMIKATDDFAKIADKKSQAEVKKAYRDVSSTCTNCHNVFRVEEDEEFK